MEDMVLSKIETIWVGTDSKSDWATCYRHEKKEEILSVEKLLFGNVCIAIQYNIVYIYPSNSTNQILEH